MSTQRHSLRVCAYVYPPRALKSREERMVTPATAAAMICPMYSLRENGAQHGGRGFHLRLSNPLQVIQGSVDRTTSLDQAKRTLYRGSRSRLLAQCLFHSVRERLDRALYRRDCLHRRNNRNETPYCNTFKKKKKNMFFRGGTGGVKHIKYETK